MDTYPATRARPSIVAIAEDEAQSPLADELDDRYGRSYDVVVTASVNEARDRLTAAARDGADVALVLAPLRSDAVALLARTRTLHPHAKRALLLRWNEHRTAREDVAHVLARGDAHYFVGTPMGSPDERFHRALTEFLDDWWRLHGRPYEAVQVVRPLNSRRGHEICDLLQRHDMPYGTLAPDSGAGRAALAKAGIDACDAPIVIVNGDRALVDPTNREIAAALGARTAARSGVYDVVVIGGGPAGLAAAVSAGSEGLRTALVERTSMGGQAGTSSLIRNYLGFPGGISGAELAGRAFEQAILFGTDMVYAGDVVDLRAEDDLRIVELADGTTISTRTVVIATGVSYRRLDVESLESLTGLGVFYGAAMSEARALSGEHAVVVGGGNSAGQAAMHLAHFARQVTMLVRSSTLAASMSDYLVKAIDRTPNIDVRYDSEVVGGGGSGRLEWIDIKDRARGNIERTAAAGLFVLIGADPCTDWLPPIIGRDDWGYIATGAHCEGATCGTDVNGCAPPTPASGRAPFVFETTMPGVFAVGDVRQGSIKRVAAAAGEGSVCVRLIHEYLAEVLSSGAQS